MVLSDDLDSMCQKGGKIPFSSLRKGAATKKDKQDTNGKSLKKKPKKNTRKKRPKRSLTRKRRTSKEKIERPKNCSCGFHKYTGQELTPRGLGRCEECIPENVILRGKDDELYRNEGGKWVRV